ncbi:hypothetical protein Dsin_026472 [Dipteronia sinensis]|uniref:Uncharacterized protein n=1 Tax=Dipteronia sinensis TaxID=43782 RepID=A0AAD9ZYA9_9ROSI|nr:hypothetical protein Dsin_026472 [Dipteronia sinensis]
MADSQSSYPKPPQFHPNLTGEPPLRLPVEPKRAGTNKPARKNKSFTDFLCKFLFFALFLIAIPLFPSRAPGFISQSLPTKLWELVHLLFIGVAVSYGLFCRRNVDADVETHTTNDDDSESYVSRVFRVSSIFEDGFDNSCGYGEKNMYQTLYSENFKASESLVDTSTGNSAMSEQKKIGSFNSELGFEYSSGFGANNVSQAWNSQYFQGESEIVVAQPDCSINRYGESGSMMDHKSLNLPIRSLRSGDRNFSDGSESNSPSLGSSNSPCVGIDNEFGYMDPTNLENRFDETDSFSPIPWRSRSERMEFGENVGANATSQRMEFGENVGANAAPQRMEFGENVGATAASQRMEFGEHMGATAASQRMEFGENVGATAASHSHLRPLSIDETQFESMKSKSLWSTESFSSQASSVSDSSPNGLSPSHVETSELENLRMEELGKAEMDELGKGKSFRRSYPPDSKPESKKTLLNAFHIRRYSTNCSLFEKSAKKSFEDDSRDSSKSKREDPLSSDVGRSVSSNLDGNLRNLVKASSTRDTSKSKREDPLSSDVRRTVSSKFDGNPVDLVKASSRDTSKSKVEDPLSSKFVGNPGNHVKASPRGRSVRTIRSRRYAAEAMKNEERGGNHLSYKLDQKASDEVEAMYKRRHEMLSGGSNKLSSTGAKKHDLDYHRPVDTPKATFSELNKRKNREFSENLATEPKQEPAKETENLQVSSDAETVTDSVSDAGTNTNEVDKKAGEFIAKFREQIRLQKMASIDRSRGHDYFR